MIQQYIDPLTLSRVKDLPLIAKTVAQGFLHGLHNSTQRGSGVEFSQYRVYEPGDALGKIDWKLFARSDKYFVREAERESDINVWLLLDTSNSMLQGASNTNNQMSWNKLDYGRYLLATLAYLAQQQGDATGMLSLSNQHIDFLPARSGQPHLQKILLQLARIKAGGEFPSSHGIQTQINSIGGHGLVFVVSDFYQKNQEITHMISSLVSPKTDVIAVQLESDDEITFPYKGQIRFEDLESQQQLLVSAKRAKQHYLQNRAEFNQQLDAQMERQKVQLLRANIDKPLDQTLFDFLVARKQLA
ncbi:DUF58 domain-containing protein [Aliiglaciecola lipolytica]|uniref:DUF58 domain-containing protein n=1 Tax=Aliiglaciecola lipolytica E3 TaxID=1127673 RepID=K6YSK5_9ALTE|nr:DUF58 domain-containing protein [Aliiglaciecola lipolytica]GAC14275.1 hypothetical protein GLIP_1642 [Aliiglaciecola lipolytica E3]